MICCFSQQYMIFNKYVLLTRFSDAFYTQLLYSFGVFHYSLPEQA